MTFLWLFLANPHFILQISHAKIFKMKYARYLYNNDYYPKIFIKSQRQIMCGSNFYGSDLTYDFCQFKVSTRLKNHTILYLQSHFWNRYHRSIWLWQLSYEDLHHFKTARNQTVHFFCPYFRHVSEWASFSTTDPQD